MLREVKGLDVDGSELDRMEAAIDAVHEEQGLRCGPALAGPGQSDIRQIAHKPTDLEPFLLLAA